MQCSYTNFLKQIPTKLILVPFIKFLEVFSRRWENFEQHDRKENDFILFLQHKWKVGLMYFLILLFSELTFENYNKDESLDMIRANFGYIIS